jgi:hypothetical protein
MLRAELFFHQLEEVLMRLTQTFFLGLAGCIVLLSTQGAEAASSYSNTLTGFTGDSTQAGTQAAVTTAGLSFFSTTGFNDNGTPADTTDDSNDTVVFDASGTHFGAVWAGDGGRNYMRTVIDDFATVKFTAEVTFTAGDGQAMFFGLGTGDRALFGTPDWSTQLSSASFWPETNTDKFTQFKTNNDSNAFVDTNVLNFSPGTHRFRMTFDPTTGFLVGSIDTNYAGGPFVADVTGFPIATKAALLPNAPTGLFSADGWPTEPSRIFFGGDDGVVFRDLTVSVVPEPTTWMLAMLGVAAVIGRRFLTGRKHCVS